MRAFLWVVAMVVLIAPPVWLAIKPEDYTPPLETVLNAALFALGLWLGYEQAFRRGVVAANDRWLPQAESAMHRVITLLATVRSFRSELSATCQLAANDLPELEREENRPVKTLFGAQCRHGARRLGDILSHLEDGLEDWSRFVNANCQGDDCIRIHRAITRRQQQLDLQSRGECGNPWCVLRQSTETRNVMVGGIQSETKEPQPQQPEALADQVPVDAAVVRDGTSTA